MGRRERLATERNLHHRPPIRHFFEMIAPAFACKCSLTSLEKAADPTGFEARSTGKPD